MKIHNVEEHLGCYCYDKGDKPMIEVRKIRNMETGEFIISRNEIVFVMEGKLSFSLSGNPEGEFNKGQIVFLPAPNRLNYKALTKSLLLIFRMNESIFLCHSFGLERLYNIMKEVEKPETLVPLEMHVHLQHFAQELAATLGDGLKCRVYLQARTNALLILMRTYYPSKQLCQFFYPILSPDTLFSEQVRMKFLKHHTVNDLADLLNMTPQQFTRRFNSVFGQAPHKWIKQEKAQSLYSEICKSNKTFKEIANQYGFSSQTYFNRFCQTEYAMSPGEIRGKNLQNN